MSNKPVVFGRDGDIEYVQYRDEHWDAVQKVMHQSFYVNESTSRGVQLNVPDLPSAIRGRADLDALCRESLADGVSLVAIETSTGRIVGHAINKMQYRADAAADGGPSFFETFRDERCTSVNSKGLVDYMIVIDALVDLFDFGQTECLLELMFLATLPDFERRGIGRRLCEHSIELARQLKAGHSWHLVSDAVRRDGRRPQLVSAIFTSTFSQSIGDRLGFERLAEKPYDEFRFEGKTFSERIADDRQKVSVLAALRI